MERDELINIWKEGNENIFKNQKVNKDMITNYLNKKTLVTSRYFIFNILFYCCIQLASIIMISMNLAGYINNPVMMWALIPQLILSICILIFGISIFYKLKVINNYSDTLSNLINKQLRFIKTDYEIWLVITSFSLLILIFAVNIFVDNDNGHYYIYNKIKYVIINIAVFLFIYGIQKYSSVFQLRALKIYLSDLKSGILNESIGLEKSKKRYKWLLFVIVIIFTIIAIVGFFKFFQFQ